MNKLTILIAVIALLLGFRIGKMYPPSAREVKAEIISAETMEHATTSMLNNKKGEDLEIAFLENMIPHHESAIEMAKALKEGTKRPELIELADTIINNQTAEVSNMKIFLNKWFGR